MPAPNFAFQSIARTPRHRQTKLMYGIDRDAYRAAMSAAVCTSIVPAGVAAKTRSHSVLKIVPCLTGPAAVLTAAHAATGLLKLVDFGVAVVL